MALVGGNLYIPCTDRIVVMDVRDPCDPKVHSSKWRSSNELTAIGTWSAAGKLHAVVQGKKVYQGNSLTALRIGSWIRRLAQIQTGALGPITYDSAVRGDTLYGKGEVSGRIYLTRYAVESGRLLQSFGKTELKGSALSPMAVDGGRLVTAASSRTGKVEFYLYEIGMPGRKPPLVQTIGLTDKLGDVRGLRFVGGELFASGGPAKQPKGAKALQHVDPGP